MYGVNIPETFCHQLPYLVMSLSNWGCTSSKFIQPGLGGGGDGGNQKFKCLNHIGYFNMLSGTHWAMSTLIFIKMHLSVGLLWKLGF